MIVHSTMTILLLTSPFFSFTSVVPAKTSPRMSGRQNEHIVPDYPTNNKINTREAFRTLNNASGNDTNKTPYYYLALLYFLRNYKV